MEKIEYQVRPVTRYAVTRWHSGTMPNGANFGGCEQIGEFDNEAQAKRVMAALEQSEQPK